MPDLTSLEFLPHHLQAVKWLGQATSPLWTSVSLPAEQVSELPRHPILEALDWVGEGSIVPKAGPSRGQAQGPKGGKEQEGFTDTRGWRDLYL